MKQLLRSILFFDSDFEFVFFRNEFVTLSGKNKKTIGWLTLILLLTFLNLAFALGSLENLRIRMENPFTNWLDIDVDSEMQHKISEINSHYDNPDTLRKFGVNKMVSYGRDGIIFYQQSYNPFKHNVDTLQFLEYGRTMEADEAIFNMVMDKSLWVAAEFKNENERHFNGCEIIISASFANNLGYENYDEIGHLLIYDEIQYFLKVVAVVEELPGPNDFIISPIFYNIISSYGKCRNQLLRQNQEESNHFIFLIEEKGKIQSLQKEAMIFFDSFTPSIESVETFQYGMHSANLCKMYFPPAFVPTLDSFNLFIEKNRSQFDIIPFSYIDCGNEICNDLEDLSTYYLAFHFNQLDHIREFKRDLDKRFQVDMDMSLVESKENFARVSNLTRTIAVMLLIFGLLCIILFTNNLLQNHLSQVKPNLGTFQAFGLDKKFLIGSYSRIIFAFLVIAIIVAYLLCLLIFIFENFVIGNIIQNYNTRFDFFNPLILYAVIGILVISISLASRTISKILKDTPGNLIYER